MKETGARLIRETESTKPAPSGYAQGETSMFQLIEERHRFVTSDWPKWAVRARPFQFTIILPMFAAIVRYYGGGSELFILVSILVMAVTVRLGRWFMSSRFQHARSAHAQTAKDASSRAVVDPTAWIKCLGMRQELDRMRSVDSNFFEPHIVEYMPYPYSWNDWVALTMTMIALFAFRGHGLVLDIVAPSCVLVGILVMANAFSRYIRIVPGRLEILRVSLLRSGDFRLEKTVSLRGKNIECHFAHRELTLRSCDVTGELSPYRSKDGTQESVDFDLRRVATPHAFVHFVIQGAICPVDAPDACEKTRVARAVDLPLL